MNFTSPEVLRVLQGVAIALFHLAGVGLALHALMKTRTSQGAIAWIIALIVLPYISIPLYLFLGRRKLVGYIQRLRRNRAEAKRYYQHLKEVILATDDQFPFALALCRLTEMPATRANSAEILCDGAEAFPAIFQAIHSAKNYILVQFYIIRDDDLGRKLQDLLIAKAQEGLRVFLIYDDIGSHTLKKSYIKKLRKHGIQAYNFSSTRLRSNRFQLNFRNHRKLVIVDGEIAFLGGLNIGDEYLGKDPYTGYWRDTHLSLRGPSVTCAQLAFLEDWLWVSGETPELNWRPSLQSDDDKVLVVPTGPTDESEACGLFFVQMINDAKERLWIASPYFVPDNAVTAALALAALRNVDVRILVPGRKFHDSRGVYYAGQHYLELLSRLGIKIFEYNKGFMHQKVMVVDDHLCTIGSANLDNRSFRLNFELIAALASKTQNHKLAQILENDFSNSIQIPSTFWQHRPLWMRLLSKFARLFAPIL